jgi:ABC-type sugar transport system substrate-binding protein
LLAALVTLLSVLVVACGGSSSSSSSESTGSGGSATSEESSGEETSAEEGGEGEEAGTGEIKEGLKLAYYSVGSNNTYLQAGIKAAEATAKKFGDSIDVFDGEFDGGKQLNQVVQGVTSGEYDGIILEPVNSQQLCSAATQAIEAEIPIGITNVPICTAGYEEAYEGTSIFVGGQSEKVYEQWFNQGLETAPSGEFAVMNGPPTQGNTIRAREVLDDSTLAKFPEWNEVAFDYTEYQASVALSKTQTLLQKNPNVSAIFSSYAGQTPGIISAVKAAGKQSTAKIYDLGGDKTMFKALENGEIQSTLVYLPEQEAERAIQAVVAEASGLSELEGVKVGTFWDLTTDPALHGLNPFVSKASIPKFHAIGLPQY